MRYFKVLLLLSASFCATSANYEIKLKQVAIGNVAVLIPESGAFKKSSQLDATPLEIFKKFDTYIAHDEDFMFFVVYKQFVLKSGEIDKVFANKTVSAINEDLLDNMQGKLTILRNVEEGNFTRMSGKIKTEKGIYFYQIVSRLNKGELETVSCLSNIEDITLNDKVIVNLKFRP